MERPYIICHMETSLDGKIMGKYLWLPGPEGGGGFLLCGAGKI